MLIYTNLIKPTLLFFLFELSQCLFQVGHYSRVYANRFFVSCEKSAWTLSLAQRGKAHHRLYLYVIEDLTLYARCRKGILKGLWTIRGCSQIIVWILIIGCVHARSNVSQLIELHVRIVHKATHFIVQILLVIVDLLHHADNEAIVIEDIVRLCRPGSRLILEDVHVNVFDASTVMPKKLIENLLKLANARRYLDQVAGIVLVSESHCVLALAHDIVNLLLVWEIERAKGSAWKVTGNVWKVAMDTRVKVVAAYIWLIESKRKYQVKDTIEFVWFVVKLVITCEQLAKDGWSAWNSAMQLLIGTSLHGNYIESTKCSVHWSLVVLLLWTQYREDIVVRGDHARDPSSDILWIEILEVNLHVRLQVKQLLVLAGWEIKCLEFFEGQKRGFKEVRVLKAWLGNIFICGNGARNGTH